MCPDDAVIIPNRNWDVVVDITFMLGTFMVCTYGVKSSICMLIAVIHLYACYCRVHTQEQ